MKIFKSTLFGHIPNFSKSTHPLFGAGSLLSIHVLFTPSEGYEGFKIAIFRYHGSVTMEKGPLARGNSVVRDVNNP